MSWRQMASCSGIWMKCLIRANLMLLEPKWLLEVSKLLDVFRCVQMTSDAFGCDMKFQMIDQAMAWCFNQFQSKRHDVETVGLASEVRSATNRSALACLTTTLKTETKTKTATKTKTKTHLSWMPFVTPTENNAKPISSTTTPNKNIKNQIELPTQRCS